MRSHELSTPISIGSTKVDSESSGTSRRKIFGVLELRFIRVVSFSFRIIFSKILNKFPLLCSLIIKPFFRENYNIGNLSALNELIEVRLGEHGHEHLTSDKHFHSFIMLRAWTSKRYDCRHALSVDTGAMYSTEVYSARLSGHFYREGSFWRWCESFIWIQFI
jgi:hypothetical protein